MNGVKLKRIIKFSVVYAANYRQCRLLTHIPSLVSNKLTRPCTCQRDPAVLNEVMNKGNNVCHKHVILR